MTIHPPGSPTDSLPDPPHHPSRHSPGTRRRTVRRLVVCLLVVGLIPAGISYGRALTYPGNASFLARTVDWVRASGGGPLVNLVENVVYRLRTPSTAPPAPASLPAAPAVPSASAPAPLAPLAGARTLPGEGLWQAGPPVSGHPSGLYTTFVRPDPGYPSVVAGVARFDQNLVAAHLVPGTKEPSGLGWPEGGQVPPALRPNLVATFNSGWKMADAQGGFLADGRTSDALRTGAASLVIDTGGRVTIGEWGRDVGPGPGVAAVRQNLALVIDGGRPVPGLDVNADNRFGSAKNQLQYTWRSGVGTDAAGNLVYVGGDQLTLRTLADALSAAGAVTAMELDIHGGMVDLFSYAHPAGGPPAGTLLLPTMPGPADRYLVPDQRDFFAITAR
ncbi:phosphodiester glycosidase family protein [Pseudonocardia ailaonensis]|uniref:Phosphodiester glycosidase family protein n=1 Tax=Pseudonocardia ailaonensis TaxID=367279 RepID=A0ABN2N8P1_9PSEU